jgi:Tol biopolymer transport system component
MNGANSNFMDYGPVLFDGGKRMFFASRRSGTTGGMRNPADNIYFEDIYEAVWNDKTKEWDSVSNKIGKLNSAGFDAVTHISANGEELYLTINNTMAPKIKRKDRTGSSDIAIAKKRRNGQWGAPKLITGAVNTDFFEGAATFSADGKTMYYVAQTKTSKDESTDIYVSRLQGKNWSKGEKLSANINNNGRQTTPFISADGDYLFFSSNAHDGIGGFDVYVAKRNGNNWSKPVLLDLGINSVNDDTHFKYYPDLKMAVIASIEVDDNRATYNMFTIDMTNFDLEKLKFEW